MNNIWNLTLGEYIEILERAKKNGVKAGESIEKEFLQYMKEKNKKPVGMTELTKAEMIKEQTSHGSNVLDVETNKNGNTKYKFIKGEKNNE